jgi:hypothetical protein
MKKFQKSAGYSLLALVAAVAILAIAFTSRVDTFQAEALRNKEEDFIFRGEEMARGIARFNNQGKLMSLRSAGMFPAALEDLLKKNTFNGRPMALVRKFAMKDALTSDDWEPVRVGDPRIMDYLQNWAAFTGRPLPADYLTFIGGLMANANDGLVPGVNPDNGNGNTGRNTNNNTGSNGNNGNAGNNTSNQNQQGDGRTNNGNDDSKNEPTISSFSDGLRPIVGVVSKRKGKAFRRLYGKDVTYDKWLFIYMPEDQGGVQLSAPPINGNGNGSGNNGNNGGGTPVPPGNGSGVGRGRN